MLESVSPDLISRALAGAAAGAASGLVVFLVAVYFGEPRRGLFLWLISTLLGDLLGFVASGIFSAIAAATYFSPSKRSERQSRANSTQTP